MWYANDGKYLESLYGGGERESEGGHGGEGWAKSVESIRFDLVHQLDELLVCWFWLWIGWI